MRTPETVAAREAEIVARQKARALADRQAKGLRAIKQKAYLAKELEHAAQREIARLQGVDRNKIAQALAPRVGPTGPMPVDAATAEAFLQAKWHWILDELCAGRALVAVACDLNTSPGRILAWACLDETQGRLLAIAQAQTINAQRIADSAQAILDRRARPSPAVRHSARILFGHSAKLMHTAKVLAGRTRAGRVKQSHRPTQTELVCRDYGTSLDEPPAYSNTAISYDAPGVVIEATAAAKRATKISSLANQVTQRYATSVSVGDAALMQVKLKHPALAIAVRDAIKPVRAKYLELERSGRKTARGRPKAKRIAAAL
jgi:hypothetical protein